MKSHHFLLIIKQIINIIKIVYIVWIDINNIIIGENNLIIL
jgi:hypothetical protein